jgi:gluconate 5-dehydrogenase
MTHLETVFNINGKTVLITGATGFFGRYMAKTFLSVGANVVLMARREETLMRDVAAYNNEFGEERAAGYVVDFYDHKKLELALHDIVGKHEIDIAVNNAYDLSEKTGFNTTEGALENTSYETWLHAFESGIYWAVLTTQIVGEQMKKRKAGSIINISSMYGGAVVPHPSLYEGKPFFNPPTYSVQKAGVVALTEYTASFWGQHGIRCNAIAPGPFSNTETTTGNSVDKSDPFLERLKSKTVLHRLGHPNDLQGALIYLGSDASSYMTGHTLVIDGGWTIT